MRIMPELTRSEARRVKAAHLVAGVGIVAVVVTDLTLTAALSYKRGVRAGERRILRRIAEGEAIEDIVTHKHGRRCCVQGHHHRGCCIHDGENDHGGMMHGHGPAMRGMRGMMAHGQEASEEAAQ